MKDITGRTIQKGDILAVGQRHGDHAALDIRVVAGFHQSKPRWGSDEPVKKIKTTAGGVLSIPEKTIIVPREVFAGTLLEQVIEQELAKLK